MDYRIGPMTAVLVLSIFLAAPAELDEKVNRFHAGAESALRDNAVCLEDTRKQWLGRRYACKDAACIHRVYGERLAELALLQPGINLRGDLELPIVPQLIGALAPEADRVMAPPIASHPATVTGRLVYDEEQGAFVIRERAGDQTILLLDMMRHGDNATQFPVMAEVHKDARIEARGRLASRPRGKPQFDRRHCVLLYRLPR